MPKRIETLAGRTLAGRYEILELLGKGGMGAVYRAHDRELDELVALKVIHDEVAHNPAMLERFRAEVKLARRVTHVNIARTFELGSADGIMFCTMELVDGESLRKRLRRVRALPIADAVAIAREVCAGLAAAHAADVIHRDIKPDNVLISSTGRIVLADFGVATLRVGDHAGDLSGTPEYMAPEQARGEAPTPTSDVYAVGVLLFEMLTGQRAFTGSLVEVLLAKEERARLEIDLATVPSELARVIGDATARDPDARIAGAFELGRRLEPWAPAVIAPAATHRSSAGVEQALHTVVVLAPTADGDDSRLHLAAGVREELLAHLARRPRLRVLARVEGGAIAGGTVVELRAGRTLSLVIHHRNLAKATTLEFPLRMADVALSAEAAAAAIVSAVADDRPVQATQASEALELMWRARAIARLGFDGVETALELLERAYAMCPEDPRIGATLAMACLRFSILGPQHHVDLSRVVKLVTDALAHGPHLAESHVAAGHLVMHTGDAGLAAGHFRTAIACSPYTAEGHEGIGRMLIEAGFLDEGLARLDDALAISPSLSSARWDIARAYALEERWDLHDELLAVLVRENDRPVARLRFMWWRGDFEGALAIRARFAFGSGPDPFLFMRLFAVILDREWPRYRDELVAYVRVPTQSRRRPAFLAQLIAEAAGYANDVETCHAMIEYAVDQGLFDLHWFERSPFLAAARATPQGSRSRERIKRRADAILDALYGDAERDSLFDTVIS
jgi:tetratricopeptide (TPR) repeat protein